MRVSCLLSILFAGCAGSAAVRGDKRLPVRNVVLYRSGVGYFERSGKFDGEAIEFQVKPNEVGDFLASLTVVERTRGGVRSVSFDVPEPVAPPVASEGGEAPQQPARPAPEPERVDVRLAFGDDGEHDLSVAYVVGSPVWRPSYRVVFDGSGQALLQAWAVVQNTSGEDWRDVKLSLTTGAPISFRSDLGTPITPERPLVSDSGEVVSYVPTGETVVAQGGGAGGAAQPAPAPAEVAEESAASFEEQDGAARPQAMERERQQADLKAAVGSTASAKRRMQAAPAPPRMDAANLARSVQAQATSTAVAQSVTRYDLSDRVTIPNGGSTMVALVSTRVTGEQAHLFAPEGGVALSHQHPFSVARLNNGTGSVLEKGPISVLSNGAFLGQGLVDTLPRDAQAFVPFSLDKSIVVEPSERYDEEQGSLVRVQRGLVTVQRFSQRKSSYTIRNGGTEATKLYVRHMRWGQAQLLAPPAGTELAPDKALVPISVGAKSEAKLEIVERTPVELALTIMDPRAAEAITLYLSGPAAGDPQSAELKRALELRSELMKLNELVASSEREQEEITNAAGETRRNLKAIEKLPSAKDLRDRLYQRLKQLDSRAAELTQQLIEARTKRAELEVRLNEALELVTLTPKV
jgi:hypothetical protein